MRTIQLQYLIDNVIDSAELHRKYYIDRRIDADLEHIEGNPETLSVALSLLMDNSRYLHYTGGFLSLQAQNFSRKRKDGPGQLPPVGRYVKLTICHVEMENMKVHATENSVNEIERYANVREAHSIIQEHRGFLRVESFREKGCSFLLYFPISRNVAASQQTCRERILVVDDNPIQRAVIKRILLRQGYAVSTCSRGKEAVRYVEEHPQDLLVLDMMIGDITGTETYSRVLEFEPEQKAIIVSGSSPEELVVEAIRLGAGAFLPKPVSSSELAIAVRKELDKGRKTRPS